MNSTVLTEGLAKAFKERSKRSTEVWFASAWVTPNAALDDLAAKRCKVRALVGTHGNATDPDCLEKMLAAFTKDSLRIVGNSGPLFHPKLYLFRRAGSTYVAWIGSANFTGGGLDNNREILLETDDSEVVAQLEAWFEAEWQRFQNQDVEEELTKYRMRRSKFGVGDLTTVVEPAGGASDDPVSQVEFMPTPDRTDNRYTGQVTITSTTGEEEVLTYGNSTQALCCVLDRLQRSDGSFLEKCAQDRAFQQRHRTGEPSWWVSQKENLIKEVRAGNGELGEMTEVYKRGIRPVQLECGWWVSRDRSAAQYWGLVRAACQLAGAKLVPESDECGL